MIGVTIKKRIITLFLIIGAVAGATAPFLHIFYPKVAKEKIELEKQFGNSEMTLKDYKFKKSELKEKYRFVGFTNKRRFMYAMGLPVALFVISFFGLMAVKYITNDRIKLSFTVSSTASMFTAVYFVTWTLWAYKTGADYHRWLYYVGLCVTALLITISSRLLVNGWYKELESIRRIKLTILDFFLELKNQHFKSILKTAMQKDLYDETYQETLKTQTKQFQKSINEKADEIYR